MNYTDLVNAAKAYADNSDIEVAGNMDIFILMTEARVNRLLKTREQSARVYVDTVLDQEYYSLPPDYAGLRDIQLDSALPTAPHKVYQFNYLSPEQMNVKSQSDCPNIMYYTIIANQLQIFPTLPAGQSIELVYYQKVPNLSASNTTNWASNSHPDIYLAGMTGEISLFNKDYDIADGWFARLESAISELQLVDVKERWSGQSMTIKAG
tara:strand:+ start:167 stop:793 length:627 start_codon:yes stop_codon:yes gene_type:complete